MFLFKKGATVVPEIAIRHPGGDLHAELGDLLLARGQHLREGRERLVVARVQRLDLNLGIGL